MLLRHSFDLTEESIVIDQAVEEVLDEGIFTADLSKSKSVTTSVMGDAIAQKI